MRKLWVLFLVGVFLFLPVYTVRAAPQSADLLAQQLVIILPSRTLELYSGGRLLKRYPVAIGKPSTPTPVGYFSIQYKEVNPAWYPPDSPGRVIPSGPYNPLGYRWMGFLPTYGVHGTNTPESIGLVVSNGCIRMLESDVEELYEVVNVDTPLKITYERIRVGIDSLNRAYIAVYPDVYGRQSVTVQDVREKLHPHGWNEWIDDDTIRQVIEEAADTEYAFLQFHNLLVNGKHLVEKVQVSSGRLLLPMQAVGEAVNAKVSWDELLHLVKVGNRTSPGIRKGQTVFAPPESIPVLFGGRQTMNSDRLEIEILTLTLNGKSVAGDFPLWGEPPMLPVLTVADSLGQKIFWDEGMSTVVVREKKVKVQVIDRKPYLPIDKIFEFFGAYVYWDEAARNIDLTFPFHEPSGE